MAAASRALHVWQYEWFISICLKSGNTKPLVAKWPCCFKDIFIYIYIYIYIIHELPSITIFLSWVMWFARVKIIGKSHHEWPKKSLFTVTNALLNFAHAILCPEYIILLKQSSVAHFAIVALESLFWLSIVTSPQLVCDVTRTRGTGIVTSYSSIVLARANWQKTIFTSE